nr:hypothetical protein [Methylobacterium sp. ZNC0032]
MRMMGFKEAVSAYSAASNRRDAVANTLALVIASNQPFYPLYLYWAVSPTIWPSFFAFSSTPMFALVPLAMRRHSTLGRSLFLIAGIGNTLLCRFIFGDASGVDVFLFPCLMLAVLLFDKSERVYAALFVGLGFVAYLIPASVFGGPVHLYLPEEYSALARLNFLSAASLTVVIGWLLGPIGKDPSHSK